MRVLIRGTGTIGKPLIRLALDMQKHLDVKEVLFHKHLPAIEARGMLVDFCRRGAKLTVDADKTGQFTELLKPYRLRPHCTFEEAVEQSDVIIDCTDKGIARKTRPYYERVAGKKLFIAQGSEKGFGKPYAFDINDAVLDPNADRFLQVVSCNTHQVLCLLKTLVFDPNNTGDRRFWNMQNLRTADLHLARRDADISQDEGIVGPVVDEPSHAFYGTHQAEDAARVLATLTKKKFDIHTAADVLNQPFMHLVYFNLFLRETVDRDEVLYRLRKNPLVGVSYLKSVNRVFAEGRERGASGRILNQTVCVIPSIEVRSRGRQVIGRCFTPQDGNALLSSVAAMLWFKNPANYLSRVKTLFFRPPYLFEEV